ncbi:multiple sugar transport system substrate-binding protein [Motilibacter peucedani]|uniref:Multiple sugar transport system substrate-binding protein n=1 Tax=Motilibacter peucedani TaxID=598650 RepID=A0A420XT08_9ACTN|nr:ABC transporter substrate-binding protein [Motilibacter peucedani]RKS77951.1 multiple sugar transport system substrate-binding protein [Motilibacter peucedani]
MTRSRRTRVAVASALALPLALAACGGSSGGGTQPTAGGSSAAGGATTTLRVLDYYNNDPGKTVWQKALEGCAAQAGAKISREAVPGASLIPKVLQQASSRTLPDLLMLDNPDLQQIAATGALIPLDQFGITGDGFAKGVVDASTYKGKLYGLQPSTNTIALIYNKDILDKAGVKPPTTWDELKATAKQLTKGGTYGFAVSAPANYEGTWQFLPFMWTNGGDEKDINTPQVAQAVQLWVDLMKDGSLSKSALNWTQADVNDQFKAGKAAMMINGPWQFPVLDAAKGLNYGVAQIPAPKAGEKVVAPLGGETWTVPQTKDKDKQALAAKVVQCLNSDESQLNLAKQNDTIPTKTALLASFSSTNPHIKAFADQIPTARARTGELGADWPKAATKIYTAFQAALTGQTSAADAVKQAQNG